MAIADDTENRLLPSLPLIERVLAADASYTISRMRVLERIPGNPIGIGYRRIDDKAVALVSLFLPSFRRVIGLRPGHEGEIEPLLAWYRGYGVKPTFEIVPGMYDAALGRELARHGFLPSGFHAALIGEPDRATQRRARRSTSSRSPPMRRWSAISMPMSPDGAFRKRTTPSSRPMSVHGAMQPGWSLYLARVDGRPAAAATLYVADRVAYLADAATAPAYRGRGLHAALLRRRIRDASTAGIDFVFSGAEPLGTSHRNMERAGLRLHFLRTKWTAI